MFDKDDTRRGSTALWKQLILMPCDGSLDRRMCAKPLGDAGTGDHQLGWLRLSSIVVSVILGRAAPASIDHEQCRATSHQQREQIGVVIE